MSKGGARNRSGPQPDPESLTSARRGLTFDALDPSGFQGNAPAFPLPEVIVYRWEFEDKRRFQVPDGDASERFSERELELWAWAWATPQAIAWSQEPWRWHAVAMWVRTATICEGSDATAADKNSLHRFADQIGLTPAGLRENGWTIRESSSDDDVEEEDEDDVRGRLTVVNGGAA